MTQRGTSERRKGQRRRSVVALGVVAVLLAGIALVVGGASPAQASACGQMSCAGNTNGAYHVMVSVTFTGDAAPGGGGSSTRVRVAPVCYWYDQSANMGGMSIKELSLAIDYQKPTREGANQAYWNNPPASWWAPYIAQEAAGASLTAYEPTCQDGNSTSGGDLTMLGAYGLKSSPYGLVITAGAPPQPALDPRALIQVAYDNMQLTDPAVDHNPRITAVGGGTLVHLPTYFWVTDPLAMGGPDGSRRIRATAAGVWAEVVATSNGLTLISPGSDTTTCSRAQALTRYGQSGTPCTVVFDHASTGYAGGYPVTATSTWNARYRLSTGDAGGLQPKTQVAPNQPVPVGETQAIVNAAG